MNFEPTPLNDEELDWFDQFLLDRVDDDADTEGKNEGVLNVSELDGFLTALVSGPVVVPPSRWLPVVWGDFEPEWKNAQEFEAVFALLIRHMNGIAATLRRSRKISSRCFGSALWRARPTPSSMTGARAMYTGWN